MRQIHSFFLIAFGAILSLASISQAEVATPDTTTGETAPFRIELFSPPDREDYTDDFVDGVDKIDEDPWLGEDWDEHEGYHHLNDFSLGSWIQYNRVEGLALSLFSERGLERDSFLPSYRAGLGYGFASQRGKYHLGFEQPIVPKHKLTLGAHAYRNVESYFLDNDVISDTENSLSALFFHRDYRNWYETEGARAWLGIYPSPFFRTTIGIRTQDEKSLDNKAEWSVWRQRARFGANPAIDEGTFRAYDITMEFDNHDEYGPQRIRHDHKLTWERSEESLDSDFDLWRLTLNSRSNFRLTPRQNLIARVLVGTGSAKHGDLPVQRRFYLGGIGTLRGHNYRDMSGNNAALLNLQYEFEVEGSTRALVLVDAGTAWDKGKFSDQAIAVDLGAGVRFGEEGISFLLAKNVNDSDSDI
ncbi:MAG: BamA/TamA family outer membrane protein, partial [Candidatus Eisenbacteria bacterium]|nr:BamA/TamA family outer membrane protein [Candidatus Eisenbacteria bacterium]